MPNPPFSNKLSSALAMPVELVATARALRISKEEFEKEKLWARQHNMTIYDREEAFGAVNWTPWREINLLIMMLSFIVIICVGACISRWLERRQDRLRGARSTRLSTNDDDEEGPASDAPGLKPVAEAGSESRETPSEPRAAGMENVRRELEKLRLGQYAEAFEREGYDYWLEILKLPKKRFVRLVFKTSMTANHADRLYEQLAIQRKAMGIRGERDPDGDDLESCVIL